MPSSIAMLAVVLIFAAAPASGYETLQQARNAGVLLVGIHSDDGDGRAAERVHRFAETLGIQARLVEFRRADRLLEALDQGRIQLVGSPVDMARPVPDHFRFTVPVDQAPLQLVGRYGAVAVRFASDEWHRALALRQSGEPIELRVVPAGSARDVLFPTPGARALVFDDRTVRHARMVAPAQPRAWVVRRADRVLAFKADRFLYAEALLRDARQRALLPEPGLIRAVIQGASFTDFDHLAQEYARFYGFDWRLILAVMHTESRFDPTAVSRSGAQGLMQLKPVAAREVGIADISDPRSNVLAGVRYLAWAREQFEADLDPAQRTWLALAAYNGGLSRVQAARRLAARSGRDPRAWSGSIDWALLELGRQHGDFDARQIVDYVEKVRARLGAYVRATEGAPPAGSPVTAQAILAP